MRVLRKPEVRKRTGLSDPQIWRLENRGEFPRRVRISANAVAWIEEEVDQWIKSRPREIGKRPPPAEADADTRDMFAVSDETKTAEA